MVRYTCVITADIGKMVPVVGEMLESVNDTMANCGHRVRISARTSLCEITFELSDFLPANREKELGEMIAKDIGEKFPELDVQLESVSGKSCDSRNESVSL